MGYERAKTLAEKQRRMRAGLVLLIPAAVLFAIVVLIAAIIGSTPGWLVGGWVVAILLIGIWIEWRLGSQPKP